MGGVQRRFQPWSHPTEPRQGLQFRRIERFEAAHRLLRSSARKGASELRTGLHS